MAKPATPTVLPAGPSQQKLRQAQQALRDMPRTADDFRREMADTARQVLTSSVVRLIQASDQHGYQLSAVSLIDIYNAVADAVAQAIMKARVRCDHERQVSIVSKMQAAIIAAGGRADDKVATVTRPNPGLLKGEAK